jgi:hypothetical protein
VQSLFRNVFDTPQRRAIESAPRLNNRSFTLANRCFSFTPAPAETEGENDGANCNQELFHEVTPNSKYHKKVSLFFDLQLLQKSHTPWQYSADSAVLAGASG